MLVWYNVCVILQVFMILKMRTPTLWWLLGGDNGAGKAMRGNRDAEMTEDGFAYLEEKCMERLVYVHVFANSVNVVNHNTQQYQSQFLWSPFYSTSNLEKSRTLITYQFMLLLNLFQSPEG